MTVRHALDDNSFKLLVECREFADWGTFAGAEQIKTLA